MCMTDLNYDPTYWSNPCPKVDCRKKNCKCGLKYVNIPAALEQDFAPVKGAYCNAIVEYEGSGAVYIYSAEGIPVLIKEGDAS